MRRRWVGSSRAMMFFKSPSIIYSRSLFRVAKQLLIHLISFPHQVPNDALCLIRTCSAKLTDPLHARILKADRSFVSSISIVTPRRLTLFHSCPSSPHAPFVS